MAREAFSEFVDCFSDVVCFTKFAFEIVEDFFCCACVVASDKIGFVGVGCCH